MKRLPMPSCRRLVLLLLMTFTLMGVQLAQNSVLHQHAQHSVDCALCHFQLGDDIDVDVQPQPASTLVWHSPLLPANTPLPLTPRIVHYHSRAPPAHV
ncbi:MAG TPA: hypothetical protein VNR18_12210 [Hyphomicrobiales bacterium]|nr:hypothetical protein [Hyphomicrobiales bacterium]